MHVRSNDLLQSSCLPLLTGRSLTMCNCLFFFLLVAHSLELSTSEVLLAPVLSQNVFECPGSGVFRRGVGVPNGYKWCTTVSHTNFTRL